MKYIKEFRNPNLAKKILNERVNKNEQELTIMEVCGTHTMAIYRNGIRSLLSENINLISGPGCPVCVTPQGYIDAAIELCQRNDVIVTTFADMLKVPGTFSSLRIQKTLGRDVRTVTSPIRAIEIANKNPKKEVVFLGVGFETTAPIIALSIYMAKRKKIDNFSVLQSIKTMPNALKKIVLDNETKIDGFLCPGHVSTVIGVKPFEFLSKKFNLPAVIAGFEYCDIIAAIYFLTEMINKQEAEVKNIYSRIVRYDGNEKAISIMEKVFNKAHTMWRGLGLIENTGFEIKEEYKDYDAQLKFNINFKKDDLPSNCLCGEILKGIKKPTQCQLFSKICNPANPIGPCMITREGTCSIYYKYSIK